MDTKTCFKCHETKPLSEFYVHPQMGDGHLGKCKECTKRDVAEHRRGPNREQVLEYDRQRARTPERKARNADVNRRYFLEHPERKRAVNAVQRAKERGDLVAPERCSLCGEPGRIHAHHPDYSHPLEVEWLCEHCHRAERHSAYVAAEHVTG